MGIDAIRNEIEHMRRQILRQRKEIRALRRSGIPGKSAEELLERMLANVDGLCIERDRLVGEQRRNIPALIRSSMDQQSGASGEMVRPQSG
jgi:hypothetical protein